MSHLTRPGRYAAVGNVPQKFKNCLGNFSRFYTMLLHCSRVLSYVSENKVFHIYLLPDSYIHQMERGIILHTKSTALPEGFSGIRVKYNSLSLSFDRVWVNI